MIDNERKDLSIFPPFQSYLKDLKELFDIKYKGLRKCRKSDATYSQINGYLDALEKAINLVDEE